MGLLKKQWNDALIKFNYERFNARIFMAELCGRYLFKLYLGELNRCAIEDLGHPSYRLYQHAFSTAQFVFTNNSLLRAIRNSVMERVQRFTKSSNPLSESHPLSSLNWSPWSVAGGWMEVDPLKCSATMPPTSIENCEGRVAFDTCQNNNIYIYIRYIIVYRKISAAGTAMSPKQSNPTGQDKPG